MIEEDRLISGEAVDVDVQLEVAIRPNKLADYIGQEGCKRADGNFHCGCSQS